MATRADDASRARSRRSAPRVSTSAASSTSTVSTTRAATTLSTSSTLRTGEGSSGRTTAGDSAAVADGAMLFSTARGAAGVMDTVRARWAGSAPA
jgi:hypothetical protein